MKYCNFKKEYYFCDFDCFLEDLTLGILYRSNKFEIKRYYSPMLGDNCRIASEAIDSPLLDIILGRK